jgi:hypothetical protein
MANVSQTFVNPQGPSCPSPRDPPVPAGDGARSEREPAGWAGRLERRFRRSTIGNRIKRFVRWPADRFIRWRDRQTQCRYYLAVCAIFKNEARFLKEWLAFHNGVGVEHFYLYNNNSSDDCRTVLAPWIAGGIVTLLDWPEQGGGQQRSAYRDCVRRARREARWLALIDIDEFLFSPLARDIRPLLRHYEGQPSVFVYWHMFGSSGHVCRPPVPVVEAYTRRRAEERNFPGKSIANPRLTARPDVHICKPRVGKALDEKGMAPPNNPTDAAFAPSWNTLRINHYWSRSIEDLHEKVARGHVSFAHERELENHLKREQLLNDVEDRTIQALWALIKERPGLP